MAGPDGRDPFSIQTEPDDFLADIDKGVKGMRFAWTDDFGFAQRYAAPESARVIALCRAEATKMGSLGASVEETKEVWDDIMTGRMAPQLSFYPTDRKRVVYGQRQSAPVDLGCRGTIHKTSCNKTQ